MNDFLEQMGRRIAARRKEKGLTQEALSEIVGVSEQTISTAECGKKALRPENIVRISIALDCTTDYLLTGVDSTMAVEKMNSAVNHLTPFQYQCLNGIVDRFLMAVNTTET